MNTGALMSVGITLAVLWAAHKYGPAPLKVAAAGVAGFMIINQIPRVRDGVGVRLIPDAPAATA